MPVTRVWGIRAPLKKTGEEEIRRAAAKALGLRPEAVTLVSVVRRSLDARKNHPAPVWVYTLDVELSARPGKTAPGVRAGVPPERPASPGTASEALKGLRVVVVGTGPAGLFGALAIMDRGGQVEVLEQGPPMEDRVAAVRDLWRTGALSADANVQFGEGGAGTFSDGKLTTRIKAPEVRQVIHRFVEAGAPQAILEEAHPHLGTDGVRRVVRALRTALEARGARFTFRARAEAVERTKGGYRVVAGDRAWEAPVVLLAFGHSSRRLTRGLMAMGVPFRAKGFAVGVRVEHPQAWVDQRQYGSAAGGELPPAEYFLTFKDRETGRGVYSFCMCPGGVVVNSASEPETLVTNGMSMSHRASGFANAGIVVTVAPEDFGADPCRGLAFQEELERRGYLLGGGGYAAPAQHIAAFLEGVAGPPVTRCTFRPGVRTVSLRGFFPDWIEQPLARGLAFFDQKMPGFVERGILLAPETRTSSPAQVVRSSDGCPEGFPGLLLAGEGAGWSGGITSSAVDALRCVEAYCRSLG
jgi:uncharacterized FAD-dependent dehydrogenase